MDGKAYSNDLRERVAASVTGGRSCRETATLFGVSAASAVKWAPRLRATGSAASKPLGRSQPRKLEAERGWLLARLEAKPDLTIRALAAELAARGVVAHHVSVWRIVRARDLSFNRNTVRRPARPRGCRPQAPALEGVAAPA